MKSNTDGEYFEELRGKTIENVVRLENGCLLVGLADNTCIGIYNKGEFTEDSFELGIDFYNWDKKLK